MNGRAVFVFTENQAVQPSRCLVSPRVFLCILRKKVATVAEFGGHSALVLGRFSTLYAEKPPKSLLSSKEGF